MNKLNDFTNATDAEIDSFLGNVDAHEFRRQLMGFVGEQRTLREWLAGMALQGLLANPGGPIQANGMSGWGFTNCTPEQVAQQAIGMADVTLAALKGKGGA